MIDCFLKYIVKKVYSHNDTSYDILIFAIVSRSNYIIGFFYCSKLKPFCPPALPVVFLTIKISLRNIAFLKDIYYDNLYMNILQIEE